jgi:hypothetical protein
MSKSAWLIFLFIIAIPVFTTGQNFNPKTVVPAKLSKYSFGMTLDAFIALNKNAVKSPSDENAFRIELTDTKPGAEFKSVTYYFDAESNKPLYEMIIDYPTEKAMNAYVTSKLKTPNDGDKWKWKTKEGYFFKAWTFGKKLVFALALPSTEWDETRN